MNKIFFSVCDKKELNSSLPNSVLIAAPNLISSNYVRQIRTLNSLDTYVNSQGIHCATYGQIDNIKQLCKQFPTIAFVNINQFIADLYLEVSEQLPFLLKGNFIYLIWDELNQKLNVGIDSFNSHQIYYWLDGHSLYISDCLTLISKLPNFNKSRVNTKALAKWLNGQPDPFESLFEQVQMIPNGCQLTVHFDENSEPKPSIKKFWDIDPNLRLEFSSDSNYEEHFHELLNNSIRNRITNHSVIGTQMSGGLDSTSVTALTNKHCVENGFQHHILSHTYANSDSCNEIDNIKCMLESLKQYSKHFIELDRFQNLTFKQLYPCAFDGPGIFLSPKYAEELALVKSFGGRLVLTGNGGDEVCWGHSATYRTRLLNGDLAVITEVLKSCNILDYSKWLALKQVFIKPLANQLLQTLLSSTIRPPNLPSPSWLTPLSKQFVEEPYFVNPFCFQKEPDRYYRYNSIKTTSTYNSMRSYQRVADKYDIEVYHPFFDQDLVEFSFAIPQKMLLQGAYPKWLLRKSMTNTLPNQVCWNLNKTVFDQHFANILINNAIELRTLLAHEGLQDLGLICNKTILAEFDMVVGSKRPSLNVDLLYAILTQQWFQTHIV